MVTLDLLLAPFAAVMAYVTALFVRWAADTNTSVRAAAVVSLLAMMAMMFAVAGYYWSDPRPSSLEAALGLGGLAMSASLLPLFLLILREAGSRSLAGGGGPPASLVRKRAFLGSVIALVLLNELLMGWAFVLASGSASLTGGAGPLLSSVVSSPWFLFTMAAEMLLSVAFLRDRIDLSVRRVLLAQAVLMVPSPPALAFGWWTTGSIYLSSAGMILLFIFLMEFIYRNKQINTAFADYTVRLLAVYGAMMAGLFLWLAYGSPLVFAVAVVLEMILFFDAMLTLGRFRSGDGMVWQLRPHWAFGLLFGIFVAEIFMGALLGGEILGPGFLSALPAQPLSGGPWTVLGNGLYNGFWFLTLVTGSTWFLAMMGIEMGALVVLKFRETRQRETRFRLALMLGTYALAAVYFPSIYYTRMFPNLPSGTQVPVLGWSMGIGSAPLGPSVFLVVFLTYVAVGAASVLFGRRVICSVFCTAAVMYQGTAIDTMRSFNRSSPVARKFLGSRFSSAYSAILGITMGSLVVASFTSYLDQIGALHLTIAGTDPTVFLFALYFGVVWYALFVMIPYAGTYNCVTMGWCYTGAISQAFSRLGFFRLKVKDPNICRQCTTLDCAKACPIGLVDMPGHFRTKGEFRSSKCCGVGNCVGACPYGNLYIHDVRHWLRDRIGARGRPHETVELPMVRARTASSAGPASSALRTSAGTPVRTQGPRPRGTGSFVPARSTKGGNPD